MQQDNKQPVSLDIILNKVVKTLNVLDIKSRSDSDKVPTEVNGQLFLTTRLQVFTDSWITIKSWTIPVDPVTHTKAIDDAVAELEEKQAQKQEEMDSLIETIAVAKADAAVVKENLAPYLPPTEAEPVKGK